MKKINSNSYGGKILTTGLLCAFVIPGGIQLLEGQTGLLSASFAAKCFAAAGSLLLLFLLLLLAVERCQDRRQEQDYAVHKNRLLPLAQGFYECQACGNRRLRGSDTSCPVCGIRFQKGDDLEDEG